MNRRFTDFIEWIARERPLSECYFGDCVSMHWDAWRVVRLVRKELDRMVSSTPASVLDLGCGIGIYEKELMNRWPESGILGVDLSAGNIALARKNSPEAFFARCDVEALPLPEASVDLAVAIEVMEHFLHPEKVVAELSRVVRSGGRVIIVVPLAPPIPFIQTISHLATRFIGSKVMENDEFKEHMRIYTKKTLLTQFSDGWSEIRFVPFNLMTFIIAGLEKISSRLARSLTESRRHLLDRLDLMMGRFIYAKGLFVLKRFKAK